jgi:hypothetical protein
MKSVLERFRILLYAGWNLDLDSAIDRRFKFIVVQILHPRLGVFLGVAVIVYLHQLTEVSFS